MHDEYRGVKRILALIAWPGIDGGQNRSQSWGMEWLVEFEGEHRSLESIWTDEMERLVGPLKSSIDNALAEATDPNELQGLQVIVYAEQTAVGATWGVKFKGPPSTVDYAVRLTGRSLPIVDPRN